MVASSGDGAPTGEVHGQALGRVLGGVDAFDAESRAASRESLATHGLREVRAEDWYPLTRVCPVMAAVESTLGADAVRSLGGRVADGVSVPADSADVPTALSRLDEAYRECHRGDAGGYAFRRIGDRDGRVEAKTPYPCPFDRGFVHGVATGPADGPVRLSEVGACSDDATSRCTYELDW